MGNFDELIRALRHGDLHTQYSAILALGEMGDVRAVEPLIQALKSESSEIRVEAVKALAKIGKPAMKPLIQALKDKNWGVEERVGTVVNLLSRTGLKDPEANLLIKAMKDKEMEDVNNAVKAFLSGAIFLDRED